MTYLRFYNTLDSTNNEARRLLAQGPVLDGLTLVADQQTHGRGQYGRTWVAAAGRNLTMTMIHIPEQLPLQELPAMNMKVALGIIHGLRSIEPGIRFRIKWPNDIYVGDLKLCGTLIENSVSGGNVQHMIIGIGLNVNENEFPADLPNPVSLFQLTGKTYDLHALAAVIREHVMRMLSSNSAGWKAEYDERLYGLGSPCDFESKGSKVRGTIKGVNSDGRLLLRMESGEVKAFGSHEISSLPPFNPSSPSELSPPPSAP